MLSGLSVVVPVFDEEENVEILAGEIEAALRGGNLPWEMIFVDDGSGDATLARLRAAQPRHPQLRIVALPGRCGQSAATVAGVRAATLSHVATIDGDLQNDPADLPRLVACCRDADVVIGRRLGRRDSGAKKIASRIANAVRRAVLHDGAADTGCSLKVFPRSAFLALPAFDGMHRFLPALFGQRGLRIAQVDVRHRPRTRGRSKYGNLARLLRTVVDLGGVVWLSRRVIPLELGSPCAERAETQAERDRARSLPR